MISSVSRVCFVVLFSLLSACGVVQIEHPTKQQSVGWVVPSQIVLAHDQTNQNPKAMRLYATAWVEEGSRSAYSLALTGIGAPAEPVKFEAPGCVGVALDNRTSHLASVDSRCSFDASNLAEGRYKLELRAGTNVVAQHEFDLVTVAAPGKTTRLEVDPAMRVAHPYFHPQGLVQWVAVDARGERKITTVWFKDGKLLRAFHDPVMGPGLGGRASLFSVVPTMTENLATKDGHYEIVTLSDNVLLGSWAFDVRIDSKSCDAQATGIEPAIQDHKCHAPLGPLQASAKSSAVVAVAQADAAAFKPAASVEGSRSYPEPLVCASAESAKADDLVRRLHDLEETMQKAGWSAHDAATVLTFRFSTDAEKNNASATIDAVETNLGKAGQSHRRLRGEITKEASAFKKGCLARYLPAKLVPMLEQP
jgi:hypothetical protein